MSEEGTKVELAGWVVTKVITEVFGIAAETLLEAEEAVAKGQGKLMQRSSNIVTKLRVDQPSPAPQSTDKQSSKSSKKG